MKTHLVQPVRPASALCFGLVLALATACAGSPSGSTASATPAAALTVAVSTALPSATRSLAATATPSLTAAPTRSRPTPTATQAAAEPTIDATALVAAVMTAQPARLIAAYDSPDKHWRVEITRHPCAPVAPGGGDMGLEQLRLIKSASTETRLIEDQLLYCGGLGAYGLEGLFWSSDSRYFYYTNAREGQPDGGCAGWYRPATRLEPATGERVSLVQGPPSPAGEWEAGFAGTELVVWNGQTGEIIRTPAAAEGQRAGAVAWAPDGGALVYLVWSADCVPAAGQVSVVRFDLASRQQSLLLTGQQVPAVASVIWDAPNRVRLFTMDNHEWRFNLVTGTLSQFS